MNKLIVTALTLLFAAGVHAQAPAAAPAKPAAPAAKPAVMAPAAKPAEAPKAAAATKAPKAAAGSCEAKAVSKAGKPLHGAAKGAFMKKCEKEAAGKK